MSKKKRSWKRKAEALPGKYQAWYELVKKHNLSASHLQAAMKMDIDYRRIEELEKTWAQQEHEQTIAFWLERQYRRQFQKDIPQTERSIKRLLVEGWKGKIKARQKRKAKKEALKKKRQR